MILRADKFAHNVSYVLLFYFVFFFLHKRLHYARTSFLHLAFKCIWLTELIARIR